MNTHNMFFFFCGEIRKMAIFFVDKNTVSGAMICLVE